MAALAVKSGARSAIFGCRPMLRFRWRLAGAEHDAAGEQNKVAAELAVLTPKKLRQSFAREGAAVCV